MEPGVTVVHCRDCRMGERLMKVIVSGAGNMGGALIDRWRSSDGLVVVSVDPATETSASTDHFNSLEMVPKDPVDFVVLAVKPHQIVDVL